MSLRVEYPYCIAAIRLATKTAADRLNYCSPYLLRCGWLLSRVRVPFPLSTQNLHSTWHYLDTIHIALPWAQRNVIGRTGRKWRKVHQLSPRSISMDVSFADIPNVVRGPKSATNIHKVIESAIDGTEATMDSFNFSSQRSNPARQLGGCGLIKQLRLNLQVQHLREAKVLRWTENIII
jgi:hypothetical protein